MASEKLILRRGDTASFVVRAISQDLSAYTGKFTVKQNASDETNILQITGVSGSLVGSDTEFTVSIPAAAWNGVAAGSYVYDFEVTNGTNVYTISLGFCIIENDVTR